MTEEELIEAGRSAVDTVIWVYDKRDEARRKRLYRKMREFSHLSRRQPLPNDVSISDAWLQLTLRACDLAGITDPAMWYLPLERKESI